MVGFVRLLDLLDTAPFIPDNEHAYSSPAHVSTASRRPLRWRSSHLAASRQGHLAAYLVLAHLPLSAAQAGGTHGLYAKGTMLRPVLRLV